MGQIPRSIERISSYLYCFIRLLKVIQRPVSYTSANKWDT